jgi:hypothetical protein
MTKLFEAETYINGIRCDVYKHQGKPRARLYRHGNGQKSFAISPKLYQRVEALCAEWWRDVAGYEHNAGCVETVCIMLAPEMPFQAFGWMRNYEAGL